MHPNPAFRQTDQAQALSFARARGFGTLSVNGASVPLMAHVPFLLAGDGSFADLHLVRSNPIARLPDGPAVISVLGPDGYVSPDWYGVPDQVPTWNYVAVHLHGTLGRLPQTKLREVIDRQSAHFEDQLAPKAPWHSRKMTPEVMDRMMRQILPFRLRVTDVHSTFKLGQNKPVGVRQAAAEQLAQSGIGLDADALGRMMAAPPEEG